MKIIPLSPRLRKIASLCHDCKCFADIGTDHAYLPVSLCNEDKCKIAIASDIVKGPLERAKATIKKYGMEDRISIRLGAGLSTISEGEADVVSIAGMGGLIIANILREGRNVLKNAKSIILQPMTAVSDLREFLYTNGYDIDAEYLIKDNNKIYNIICVSLSDISIKPYNDTDIYIGKHLIECKPDLYIEYLDRQIAKLKKKIEGLKKASISDSLSFYQTLYEKEIKLKEDAENAI